MAKDGSDHKSHKGISNAITEHYVAKCHRQSERFIWDHLYRFRTFRFANVGVVVDPNECQTYTTYTSDINRK